MSKIISPTIFRNNMKKVMEDIIDNKETYHVTRKGCDGMVVLSSEEYKAILRHIEWLRDKAEARDLDLEI